jgi:hypothetical protein
MFRGKPLRLSSHLGRASLSRLALKSSSKWSVQVERVFRLASKLLFLICPPASAGDRPLRFLDRGLVSGDDFAPCPPRVRARL